MAYYTEDTTAKEPSHTPQKRDPDQPAPAVLHSAPVAEDPPVAGDDRHPTDVRSDNDHHVEFASGPLEDWGKLIVHGPAATAILDRFLHHAEIITITGRSYRLKDRATAEPIAIPGKKPQKQPVSGKNSKKP